MSSAMTTVKALREHQLERAIRCQREAAAFWRASFEERESDADLATVLQDQATKLYALARAVSEEAFDDAFLRNWRNRINRAARKRDRVRREREAQAANRRAGLTTTQRENEDQMNQRAVMMLGGLLMRDVQ